MGKQSEKKELPKLPPEVFIHQEPMDDEFYLQADETLDEAAEVGETRRVGRYQLVEEFQLTAAIETTAVPITGD